jgi:hypothetical protein
MFRQGTGTADPGKRFGKVFERQEGIGAGDGERSRGRSKALKG